MTKQAGNIAVYPATAHDFYNQGLGVLRDVISSVTTEKAQDNGDVTYELELTYPIDGYLAAELRKPSLLKVATGDTQDGYQIFELYDYLDDDAGTITAYGRIMPHRIYSMTFDNGGHFEVTDTVDHLVKSGAKLVTDFPGYINVQSDIDARATIKGDFATFGAYLTAIINAVDGQVMYTPTTWQLTVRGRERVPVLRDDKNTAGVQIKASFDEIVNRIVPLIRVRNADGSYSDEASTLGKPIVAPSPFQYVNYWRGQVMKFDSPDQAAGYFSKTGINLPKLTADVKTVMVGDEFSDVHLFDQIRVYNHRLNLLKTLQVIERKYDNLTNEVVSYSLGEIETTILGSQSSTIASVSEQVEKALAKAGVAMATADGKNQTYYMQPGQTLPEQAKEGDLGYETIDGLTYVKIYHNGKWEDLVNENTGKQIQEQVADALVDVAAAEQAANDAVAKASSSTQLASMSNQTAQVAKSAADSANALATQAVSAASDAKTALATANSALETATDQKTTVATLVTKTDDLAGTIATLATKTDINKLSGEVTAAQTLAQQTADGLQLKADQSVVNTINGSVNQLRADLKVANDRLSLTMTKNDVTGLLTPYATQSWTQGQITATASQFNAQFSSISGKVDALKFGNRNLLLNTSNMNNLAHWTRTSWGSATTIVKLSTHPFYHNGRDNLIKLTTTDSWDGHLRSDVVAVKPDTDYNFQFLGFHNYNVKSITIYFLGRTDATSPGDAGDNYDRDKIHLLMNAITLSTSGTKRATATFHTNPGETLGYIRFDMNGGYNATDPADMYMVEAELAEGPTVPVYSPAPEDSADYADAKVASLKVTVDGIQSTVANYQGQTTTALQTLQGFQTTATDRINGLKLQQTQLASQWTSVVGGLSNPNLILNSMYPEDVSKLGWIDTGYLNITSHAFYAGGGQTLFSIKSTDARERTVSTNRFKVTRNTAYTVSLKAFANWNMAGLDIFVMMRKRGSAKDYDTFQLLINNQKLSPSETLSYSAIFNSGDYDEGFIRIDNNGMVDTSGDAAYLFFAEPKVELGSMATPDVQSGTDSQITQLQDAINLRVSKGDVLSQINLEANRALIQSGKLVLDAPTVVFTGNAFIPSAAIASLSADKITTGTLNAANINVINLNGNSIVSGTLSGSKISGDTITGTAYETTDNQYGYKIRLKGGAMELYKGPQLVSGINQNNAGSVFNNFVGNDFSLAQTDNSGANGPVIRIPKTSTVANPQYQFYGRLMTHIWTGTAKPFGYPIRQRLFSVAMMVSKTP
ncbi:gp58-like family protein [Lacticaseibacillus paracasei]|nr:gp58-like family protein [Lacticaseibacillus paracasei]